MTTHTQRERLRADLAADSSDLPDAEIDDLYARASEAYPANAHAVEAAARILAIHALLAAAAKRPDYAQNATSERASQVFDHLLRLRDLYLRDLQIALGAAVAYGGLRRKSPRVSETPDV